VVGNPGSIGRERDQWLNWAATEYAHNTRVMGILNPQELLGPGGRVVRGETAQSCLDLLVHALSLAIG